MSRWVRILLLILATLVLILLIIFGLLPRLAQRVGVSVPGGSPGPVTLDLPPGFEANIYAQGLDRPRFMAVSPEGVLFVADMAGRITALPQGSRPVTVAEDLDRPSSLVFHDGWLYVGETSRISRYRLDSDLEIIESQVIVPDLPESGSHVTRTVLVGRDGRLYVSIGSSCNVCIEEDERRAAVMVYEIDGSGGRVFARGLRNAVGLATHPETGEIWATNNGRDWLGDDNPPETVYIVRDGLDYGWPRCHNGRIEDPDYGQDGSCVGVESPVVEFQAHSAPLGLAFYTGSQFPEGYRGDLFIAFHGSWNRSRPTGYKVVHIPLENGEPTGEVLDFATGWLQDADTAPGRPVGLTVAPDGSLFVSDDKAGIIYRISYP
jgi:glucose/arabinose dehydrogenase